MSVVYQYEEPASEQINNAGIKKKIFLISGLLVACALLMIAVLLFGNKQNVVLNEQAALLNDRALQFTKAIHDKNDDLIKEHSTFNTNLSDEEVLENGDPLEDVRARFNIGSCKEPKLLENKNQIQLVCEDSAQPFEKEAPRKTSQLILTYNDKLKFTELNYQPIGDDR